MLISDLPSIKQCKCPDLTKLAISGSSHQLVEWISNYNASIKVARLWFSLTFDEILILKSRRGTGRRVSENSLKTETRPVCTGHYKRVLREARVPSGQGTLTISGHVDKSPKVGFTSAFIGMKNEQSEARSKWKSPKVGIMLNWALYKDSGTKFNFW